jgi:hypothetical protein
VRAPLPAVPLVQEGGPCGPANEGPLGNLATNINDLLAALEPGRLTVSKVDVLGHGDCCPLALSGLEINQRRPGDSHFASATHLADDMGKVAELRKNVVAHAREHTCISNGFAEDAPGDSQQARNARREQWLESALTSATYDEEGRRLQSLGVYFNMSRLGHSAAAVLGADIAVVELTSKDTLAQARHQLYFANRRFMALPDNNNHAVLLEDNPLPAGAKRKASGGSQRPNHWQVGTFSTWAELISRLTAQALGNSTAPQTPLIMIFRKGIDTAAHFQFARCSPLAPTPGGH